MSTLLLLHPGHLDDPLTAAQLLAAWWPVLFGWAIAGLLHLRRAWATRRALKLVAPKPGDVVTFV